MFRLNAGRLAIIAIALLGLSVGPHAATVTFSGELDLVLEDSGTSDLSDVPLGTSFVGSIDDVTFDGLIESPLGDIELNCCIAAGGLELSNDVEIDADAAAVLNAIQAMFVFSDGDFLDIINLESDTDSDAGRLEAGISLIYAPETYDSEDPSNYPVTGSDPLFSVFFLLQEDEAADEDSYSALGLIDELDLGLTPDPDVPTPSPVPLPAAGFLLLAALAGLSGLRLARV